MYTLKSAMNIAPNSMGCYKIYYLDDLVYVGKAEDGIRKRFVQYYNGTTAHYPSAKKIYEKRDSITVDWEVCYSKEEVRELEGNWIDQYSPSWNERSGWSR